MPGRSSPQFSGSAQGAAWILFSLVMLIGAGASRASAITTTPHLFQSDLQVTTANHEIVRVTGGYVSLAGLKLFQIEEEPGDDGGVQSWGSGMTFVTRLRGCAPNPFARGTSVNYELAQYGPVDLTVRDVSGRLIRRLESGPRQRGFHVVCWDGTDNRGRVVPAGVYFVRLSAGGKASTGRLTLVR